MTLDEFIAKYKGKHLNQDGVYGNQCVDLTKAYHKEVIGGEFLAGNAIDYLKNPEPKYYEYKDDHLWYVPPKGAIAIFKATYGGGRGHVGIVISASIMRVVLFEQNSPPGAPCQITEYTYNDIIGYLVPRPQQLDIPYNQLVDDLRRLINKYPKI